jgi:hypothetical protein
VIGLRIVPDRARSNGRLQLLLKVSAAHHQFKRAPETIERIPVERLEPTSHPLRGRSLDHGYDDDAVRELLRAFGSTARH